MRDGEHLTVDPVGGSEPDSAAAVYVTTPTSGPAGSPRERNSLGGVAVPGGADRLVDLRRARQLQGHRVRVVLVRGDDDPPGNPRRTRRCRQPSAGVFVIRFCRVSEQPVAFGIGERPGPPVLPVPRRVVGLRCAAHLPIGRAEDQGSLEARPPNGPCSGEHPDRTVIAPDLAVPVDTHPGDDVTGIGVLPGLFHQARKRLLVYHAVSGRGEMPEGVEVPPPQPQLDRPPVAVSRTWVRFSAIACHRSPGHRHSPYLRFRP